MGTMPGYKQITLYIDPVIYKQAAHVAKMIGEPLYVVINKALTELIKARTTPEQRKAIELLTGDKNERRENTGSDSADKKRKDSRKGRVSR